MSTRRPPLLRPLLQAALNGAREHPRAPRTPERLAEDARAAVAAGAHVLHFHAFDDAGRETLAAAPTAAALAAVRRACPGVPISLSTSAAIEPDPARRLALVSGWTLLPDLVTANQGEPGIVELAEHLAARGVGIEAGLLAADDARQFVTSGLVQRLAARPGGRCMRALVEPLDADPGAAVAHAATIEAIVTGGGPANARLEQVHHGDGVASWAVSRRALARGHGMRAGLEDTPVLPDGRPAPDNAACVRAAAALIAEAALGNET